LTKLTYIFSVSNFGNAFPTLCLLTTKCFHPNFLSHSPPLTESYTFYNVNISNLPTQHFLVTGHIYIFQLAQVKFCKVIKWNLQNFTWANWKFTCYQSLDNF